MRFIKTLILLSLTFLFANESSFRGKDRADILSGPIPMAYLNLISETYTLYILKIHNLYTRNIDVYENIF